METVNRQALEIVTARLIVHVGAVMVRGLAGWEAKLSAGGVREARTARELVTQLEALQREVSALARLVGWEVQWEPAAPPAVRSEVAQVDLFAASVGCPPSR